MNATVKLLESVLPTSVTLHATVAESHPSASILGTERVGSGTIVDESGLVLTANYVVIGTKAVEVTLLDDTTVTGTVVAQDFHTGLAVVQIPGPRAPAARPIGARPLATGQEIFILASAGGAQRRVSTGAISSLAPFDAFWEFRLEQGIMTTAMNPGLGGGALFTQHGTLAGVVSLDFTDVGRFTLAIPSEYFFDHRDELLQHGRRVTRPARAWIGLYCYVLRDHVVVAGLVPGAPGDSAGLKAGDVIITVNGERVSERRNLYERVWQQKPGDVLRLQVFRSSGMTELAVQAADAESFFA